MAQLLRNSLHSGDNFCFVHIFGGVGSGGGGSGGGGSVGGGSGGNNSDYRRQNVFFNVSNIELTRHRNVRPLTAAIAVTSEIFKVMQLTNHLR